MNVFSERNVKRNVITAFRRFELVNPLPERKDTEHVNICGGVVMWLEDTNFSKLHCLHHTGY